MKNAKSILFRAKLKGFGIVNYDGGEQKNTYNSLNTIGFYDKNDNVSYAKKQWLGLQEKGKSDFKIIISNNCLKHNLFEDDMPYQSPNIIRSNSLLLHFIATPAAILRGYMFTFKSADAIKRNSAIMLLDAIQTCNALASVETFTRSGGKLSDENQTDTSIFKKETVGDIEYKTSGAIDLMQLQFLSVDNIFDRLGLNPDLFTEYKKILSTRMPVEGELGYYKIKGSVIDIPEYGFMFSKENVVFLTKLFFKKMLELSINKSSAYADVVNVEYKIVYDPLVDKRDDDNGWTTLTVESVDSLNFDLHEFYEPVDYDKAVTARKGMEDNMLKAKETAKQLKEAKDQAAQEKKDKAAALKLANEQKVEVAQ